MGKPISESRANDPTPRRQIERRIKPAFQLSSCTTVQELACRLQKRMRQTLYARGAGTLVAINSLDEVYLLMAGEARTDKFFADNYDWVMGVYAEQHMGGKSASVPDLCELEDDIRFHLPAWALAETVSLPCEVGRAPQQMELEFPPLHELAIAA
ncbi:hypothetical protein [Stenotrophomonas humi]|nr:hypothetical protein [Stenotrophomonas humi]